MKRPLFWGMVFLVSGIFAGRFLNDLFNISLFFGLIIGIVLLFASFNKWYGSIFYILIAFIGFVSVNLSILPEDKSLEYYANNQIEIEMSGNVGKVSTTSRGRQMVTIKLESYTYNGIEQTADVNIRGILGRDESVLTGQKIEFTGTLGNFGSRRAPGSFNEFLYYKSRKLDYKTFPQITYKGDVEKNIEVYMDSLRGRFADVYDICLPEKESNLAKSMIIGDKSDLDKNLVELYRKAGIYHILAISGLHISIIVMCLNWLLGKFMNKRLCGAITIAFLIFYCFFTGLGVSTLRSAIMCSVIIFGNIIYRERDLITSISFAAICLLLYEPLYIWDIGFQYSFLAVCGLALGTPAFETILNIFSKGSKRREKILISRPIKEYFAGSLVATIFTTPIVIFNFYFIYPYSVIINMIIVPTLCITTVTGFIIGVTGLFFIDLAIFISGIFYGMVKFYEYVSNFFVSMPFAEILTGSIDYLVIGLIWVIFGILVFALDKKGMYFRRRRKYVGFSFLIFIIIIAGWFYYPRGYKITFLDIGQGDCIVITNRKNTYVIDGGGRAIAHIGKNTGERILIPFLNYSGIKDIDGAFVSHMDADHVIGIIELFGNKEIDTLYITDMKYKDDKYYDILMERARDEETNVKPILKGDVVEEKNILFQCVYPGAEIEDTYRKNFSMVLKMSIGEVDFLFTGDIDQKMEEEILNSDAYIEAEILKLAHHGSKTSSGINFLEEVDPTVSVASTGVNNSYGHPSPEVVERINDLKIMFYNTADDGSVMIKTDGKKIEIKTMLGDENNERIIK